METKTLLAIAMLAASLSAQDKDTIPKGGSLDKPPKNLPTLTDKQVIEAMKFANKVAPVQQQFQEMLKEYQKLSEQLCPGAQLKLPAQGSDEQPTCAAKPDAPVK